MLSKQMLFNLQTSSAIRKMFEEGQELAAKVGAENVCDFSLGNPAAPVPEEFTRALQEVIATEDSMELHGYMNNAGYPEVRQAVADSLNRRYDAGLSMGNIVMTCGAAGALNVIFRSLLDPGDRVAVFRPYFGEYRNYAANWGCQTVEVEPLLPSFQPDLEDLERKLDETVKVVIINNPVNPTGVIYSAETLTEIGRILSEKQAQYGHEIYLISDEPYRELAYDGAVIPYVPNYYANTFVAYSFSKSLSIPGERVGYVVISPSMADWQQVSSAIATANRLVGFLNAPSLLQKAVAKCLDAKCDVEYYDRNRRKLYAALQEYGYECVKPEGTFYLFVKSPDEDVERFLKKAKEHYLILVNGATFSGPGYLRIAYCVAPEVVERSLPRFRLLAEEYGLTK